MVAQEGVSLAVIHRAACFQRTGIERSAISLLADDVLHDGFHEAQLEVERRLHAHEGRLEQTVAHPLGHPGHETLQQQRELSVGQQFIEGLSHLLRLVRPDFVELRQLRIEN